MEENKHEYKLCTNSECEIKWYPPTEEYFYSQKVTTKTKGTHYKLTSWCKLCTIKKNIKYRQDNEEVVKERWQIYYQNNKPMLNAKTRQWKLDNPEKWEAYYSWYQKTFPEKFKEYYKERSKKNIKLIGDEWINCKNYFNNCCAYCGIAFDNFIALKPNKHKDFRKDHSDPNGENNLLNCIPSCRSCNSRKWKFPLDWWYNENNERFSQERYDAIIKWLTEDCFKFKEEPKEKSVRAKKTQDSNKKEKTEKSEKKENRKKIPTFHRVIEFELEMDI